MIQVLCQNLLTGKKEQQRDIASIGLKTVISEIPGSALALVAVKKATPHMVDGIKVRGICPLASNFCSSAHHAG